MSAQAPLSITADNWWHFRTGIRATPVIASEDGFIDAAAEELLVGVVELVAVGTDVAGPSATEEMPDKTRLLDLNAV